MEVRRISATPSELYHHGIKGQKWGVRRFQNYDGTLIGSKKKNKKLSEEERKKLKRKKIIAGSVAAASAIAITAAAVYVAKNKYVRDNTDKTIEKMAMQRIQTAANTDLSDNARIYVSNNKFDNLKYEGMYGDQIRTMSPNLKNSIYKNTYSGNNINIASNKSSKKVFSELYKNDKDFKDQVDSAIKDFDKKTPLEIKAMTPKRSLTFLKDKYAPTDNTKYDLFNVTLTTGNTDASEKFYTALKNKGYDAIYDKNDIDFSGYKTKSPLIVINGKKVVQESATKLNNTDISKANVKARSVLIAQKIAPYALPAVGATAAASYKNANDKLKEDDKKR